MDKHLLSQLRDLRRLTLLQAAVKDGTETCVKTLLTVFKGSHLIYANDATGKNALHVAAIEGKLSLIGLLFKLLPINQKDGQGLILLHWAIHERHLSHCSSFD